MHSWSLVSKNASEICVFSEKDYFFIFVDQQFKECMKINKFSDFGIFPTISDMPLCLEKS